MNSQTGRHLIFHPGLRLFLLLCAALAGSVPAHAVTLNLTAGTVNGIPTSTFLGNTNTIITGGTIGPVIFRDTAAGSGSGQFRSLFRMSDNNDPDVIERGYNRDLIMDSTSPNGFEPLLRIQDLVQNTEGGYYMFALDANESSGGNNNYLSLDMFKIYVGGANDPSPLPTTPANLGNLGTEVYSFGASDTVLLDAGGSGNADMYVFVPVSLFASFASNSLVYLFAQHGGSTISGFGASGGFEEWASIKEVVPAYLPEPGSTALAACGALGLLWRRCRR